MNYIVDAYGKLSSGWHDLNMDDPRYLYVSCYESNLACPDDARNLLYLLGVVVQGSRIIHPGEKRLFWIGLFANLIAWGALAFFALVRLKFGRCDTHMHF